MLNIYDNTWTEIDDQWWNTREMGERYHEEI